MRTDVAVRNAPGPMRRGPYMVDHGPARRVRRAAVRGGWRATKATARAGHRHRVRLAPVYLAAALWVAAFALSFVQQGWKTAFLPVALSSLVLVLYARHRRGGSRRLPRQHHAYLWGCWAGGSTWLVVATALSPVTMPLPGLLLAGTLAAGVPYWWHRRIRPHVEEVVEVNDPEYVDPEIELWYRHVNADNGELPGAELTEFHKFSDGSGWESPLQFTSHKVGMEAAYAKLPDLSRLYDVPLPNVALRPSPDGRPRRGHITVLEHNPLAVTRLWAGPTLDANGVCRVGRHPDKREAFYRFWRPESGPVHSLVSGCTDSGKSRFLDMLLAEERQSEVIASWVIDPQGGQSLPAWKKSCDQFALNAAEGRDLLEDAVAVMFRRNAILSNLKWVDKKGRQREGVDCFDPFGCYGAPEPIVEEPMPLLSITVEEAHNVLSDAHAVKCAQILATMGRKCGLKLRLVTQLPLLAQLGNSSLLREQVAAGNVIVLRCAGHLGGMVAFSGRLPGAEPNMLPMQWPDGSTTAGLGYLLGASSHSAPFRTDFLNKDDVYDWATSGELTRLDSASMGAKYEAERLRWERAQEASNEGQRALPAGAVHTTGTARDRILAHLEAAGGTARTSGIALACGLDKSTVSNTGRSLVEEGLLTQVGRGEWAICRAG